MQNDIQSITQIQNNSQFFNYKGLKELSEIIIGNPSMFVPILDDLARQNMERIRHLWFTHFDKGVSLSNGGVEDSFIDFTKHLKNNKNLSTFNMYPADRPQTTRLNQEEMKKFLKEENALHEAPYIEELQIIFSLGSHEGFTRIARYLYDEQINDGIFFPTGGYGFLAIAAASFGYEPGAKSLISSKPLRYNLHLIDINRDNGEKILLTDLERLVIQHPTAKILFLELKTTAGAIYNGVELKEIISFCKKHGLFFLADAAHLNMEFAKQYAFPDVSALCQQLNYTEFAVLYTGSKTYGLERARIGFIVMNRASQRLAFAKLDRNLSSTFGSISDIHTEVARALFAEPVEKRRQYTLNAANKHRFNMNLMVAYIEGITSKNIDEDLKCAIQQEIPSYYHQGIPGMRLIYKPEGAIQMKVDISDLQQKYFTNIRIFNSEIFCYVLNKVASVVTLHAYQIMDPKGFSLRLSFPIKNDVHSGMQAIHNFVVTLTEQPTLNPFMPDVFLLEEKIFPNKNLSLDLPHTNKLKINSLNYNPTLLGKTVDNTGNLPHEINIDSSENLKIVAKARL